MHNLWSHYTFHAYFSWCATGLLCKLQVACAWAVVNCTTIVAWKDDEGQSWGGQGLPTTTTNGTEPRNREEITENSGNPSVVDCHHQTQLLAVDSQHSTISYTKSSEKSCTVAKEMHRTNTGSHNSKQYMLLLEVVGSDQQSHELKRFHGLHKSKLCTFGTAQSMDWANNPRIIMQSVHS